MPPRASPRRHLIEVVSRRDSSAGQRDAGCTTILFLIVLSILAILFLGAINNNDQSDPMQPEPFHGADQCANLHLENYPEFPKQRRLHRSLRNDTRVANCPSAAHGDYGPCLRHSLNHGPGEGRATYLSQDVMEFFWERRPRLQERRPRSFISRLFTSNKPSLDVSRLTPTQREGLDLWHNCTYPSDFHELHKLHGQNLIIELSCAFQAFNLLFFHNTLGDEKLFLPNVSDPEPVPQQVEDDLQRALAASIPRGTIKEEWQSPPIARADTSPILTASDIFVPSTPGSYPGLLAKMLSQLLHEMIHIVHAMYTCPICHRHECAHNDFLHDFGPFRYAQMWLPLTVAIDLLLTQEGILEIPGVKWQEHRLNLHADHVVAAFKNRNMIEALKNELNPKRKDAEDVLKMREWDEWRLDHPLIDNNRLLEVLSLKIMQFNVSNDEILADYNVGLPEKKRA